MDSEMVAKAKEDHEIDLAPGFRFHPTDEELIAHYLCKKIGDESFEAAAIGEADLNKCEPWDLPGKAKMGENEWYFFYLRDKKYPTGLRTNRATEAGYWKATGKDKEIFRGNSLIGMKKTLVFYTGRAPKGEKTNWVMHEYRLEGKLSLHNLSESAKTEWVICRVFEKSCNGKKIHVQGVSSFGKYEGFVTQSQLPPLTDFSQSDVSCFSTQFSFPRAQNDFTNSYKIEKDRFMENSGNLPSPIFNPLFIQENYRFPGSMLGQDYQATRGYSDNGFWPSTKFEYGGEMMSVLQETGLAMDVNMGLNGNEIPYAASNPGMGSSSASGVGAVDLECLWPY